MKKFLILAMLWCSVHSFAQISVKVEHTSSSKFKDAVSDEYVGSGSATVYSFSGLVPLSMKGEDDDPYERKTIWGLGIGGSFVRLNNNALPPEKDYPSEVMNLNAMALHLRPLKNRWSMLMALGVSSSSLGNRLSSIRLSETVEGTAAAVFIYHHLFVKGLDVGVGGALNNTFGYPMIFPAVYLSYKNEFSKFNVQVQSFNGASLKVGYNFHENFGLNFITEIKGYSAFVTRNNRREIFSSQDIISGLQPEIKISKMVSIPITAGVNWYRLGRYQERKLSAMFKEEIEARDADGNPRTSGFNPAFYISAGFSIGGN